LLANGAYGVIRHREEDDVRVAGNALGIAARAARDTCDRVTAAA